jgi:hypothetical protein
MANDRPGSTASAPFRLAPVCAANAHTRLSVGQDPQPPAHAPAFVRERLVAQPASDLATAVAVLTVPSLP